MDGVTRAIERITGLINSTDEPYTLSNLLAARDDLREALAEALEADSE